mgnify:CR=1 FL=1|tara:strand:- start:42 stop:407 length:366 start_codon:yes stop_codon:yes gene_type:complete
MDKDLKHIKSGRNAAILAIIFSVLGFLASIFLADTISFPFPSYVYAIDSILLVIGIFGLIKKSKIATSVLLGYFLISRVALFVVLAQLAIIPILINLYIVFCLGRAIRAMNIKAQNDQENF